jgi:hypothetical protein
MSRRPQVAARIADYNWRRRAASTIAFSRKSTTPHWRALHLTDEAIKALPGSRCSHPFAPAAVPSHPTPEGRATVSLGDSIWTLTVCALPPSQHLACLGGRVAMLPPLDSAHGPSYVISGILLHIGCGRVTVCDTLVRLDSKQRWPAKPGCRCLSLFTRPPAYSVTPHENTAKPACGLETAPSPVGPREHLCGQWPLPKSRCCMRWAR